MITGALLLLAAYLIGSIPFPVLVSRFVLGIDLRQHGSGNMGALNAGRVLGKRWFPVVFGLDLAKGAAAAFLVMRFLPGNFAVSPTMAAALGGLLVVAGHCFPVFAGFKGGVGLAASGGALLILSPYVLVSAGAAILVVWALTRNMYVGVAGAALLYPFLAWIILKEPATVAVMALWGLLVLALHRDDVKTWWAEQRS
ncbi:MAG: glycerol-3-phosphate acyltransferase [Bacillota bacterium]